MNLLEIVLLVCFIISGYTLVWLIVSTAANNSAVGRLEQRLATLESKYQNRSRELVHDARNQDWN